MNTPNAHLHSKKLLLKEIQKLAEQLLHIGKIRKYPHKNRQERLRHTLVRKPAPAEVPYNSEGTQLSASVWGAKNEYLGSQDSYLRNRPPKHLALKANRAWVSKTSVSNKAVFNGCASTWHGCLPRSQSRRSLQKRPPPSRSLKGI